MVGDAPAGSIRTTSSGSGSAPRLMNRGAARDRSDPTQGRITLDPINLKGLGSEQRRRLLLVAGLSTLAFVIGLSAGALSGSQALRADALDFAATTLAVAVSFAPAGLKPTSRALMMLGKAAVLVLLGALVAVAAFYAFFVRITPESTLMGAGAVVALAANGTMLYLLRGERVAGALHG